MMNRNKLNVVGFFVANLLILISITISTNSKPCEAARIVFSAADHDHDRRGEVGCGMKRQHLILQSLQRKPPSPNCKTNIPGVKCPASVTSTIANKNFAGVDAAPPPPKPCETVGLGECARKKQPLVLQSLQRQPPSPHCDTNIPGVNCPGSVSTIGNKNFAGHAKPCETSGECGMEGQPLVLQSLQRRPPSPNCDTNIPGVNCPRSVSTIGNKNFAGHTQNNAVAPHEAFPEHMDEFGGVAMSNRKLL